MTARALLMGRAPINSGRYVLIDSNGSRQWARNQVALQAEIVDLLGQLGGMTKKRIITTLSTAQAAVETALASLLQSGAIECYRAMSARNRLDEHWCVAGHSPAARSPTSETRYNAVAVLTAMQHHAASLHKGVQR